MLRRILAGGLLFLAGCSDPTALREIPEVRMMQVFMILNPDSASQSMLAMPVTTRGTLDDLVGTFFEGDDPVAVGTPAVSDLGELSPCINVYGTITSFVEQQLRCLIFEFTPRFGATYRLTVSAREYPSIQVVTTVPGDFQVLEASARGSSPPGTEGLEVRWTKSEGAYAYLVALRATLPPWCAEYPTCPEGGANVAPDRQGWFAVTRDTVLETTVSGEGAEESANGGGPWYVDVYAVSRSLHDYLTTGSTSDLFPVPPAQNVDGGYGAVGAWVWRSYKLPE